MKRAHSFYRIMSYVTGTTLLLLTATFILHRVDAALWDRVHWFVALIGIGHGVVLYPIYMVSCFNLILKARIKFVYFFLMLISGFVPFLAFVMERYTEKNLVPRRPL